MKKIDSKYINKERLIISKNIVSYFFELVFYLAVIGLWYYMLIKHSNTNNFKEYSIIWRYLIIGLPVLFIPNIVKCIQIYLDGEVYTFDANNKTIRKNEKIIALFTDIHFVQVRTFYDSDSANEYRVSLVLKSGTKIRIEQSYNRENIFEVAEDMADILQVKIINK